MDKLPLVVPMKTMSLPPSAVSYLWVFREEDEGLVSKFYSVMEP